jgi:hypothetical protein
MDLAMVHQASSTVTASVFTSGGHLQLPWEIALPVIAVVIVLKVIAAKRGGRSALGREVVVRCGKGHLFRTNWSSLGSLTSIRLGFARFQHCPVGNHWSLVRPGRTQT